MKKLNFPFECKLLDPEVESGVACFEGYASTFDNVDRVGDYVVKGAFGEVKADTIPILWNHNSDTVLGGYTSIREDEKGLYVKGELNLGVQKAVEARALMKMGHLKHMSIGYGVKDDAWDEDRRARALKKVKLFEVSLTALAANLMAEVTAVKNMGSFMTATEFEGFLREAGLSRNEAKCVVSRGYAQLLREKSLDTSGDSELSSILGQLSDLNSVLKEMRS